MSHQREDGVRVYKFYNSQLHGTIEHRIKKPGRNQACPCGSGQKFKRCHGRNGLYAMPTDNRRRKIQEQKDNLVDAG